MQSQKSAKVNNLNHYKKLTAEVVVVSLLVGEEAGTLHLTRVESVGGLDLSVQ